VVNRASSQASQADQPIESGGVQALSDTKNVEISRLPVKIAPLPGEARLLASLLAEDIFTFE